MIFLRSIILPILLFSFHALQANARVWRDACLSYFQTFSRMPVPAEYEKPEHPLDCYMKIRYRNDGRVGN